MLVLSRRKNESIVINDDITIVVVEIRGDKVRLGVEAPREMTVHRREVFDALHRNDPPPDRERGSTYPTSPPAAYRPAQVTLSSHHVDVVDRLRNAIQQKAGTAPCREQTIAAILDAVEELEKPLCEARSLADLKSLLVQTPTNGSGAGSNGHSRSVTWPFVRS